MVLFTLLAFIGCSDEDPILVEDTSTSCKDSTFNFQNLFQSLVTSGYEDKLFIDTEIHEYTFTLSEDKEVCEIGYQSFQDIASTPYLIEIIDTSSNTIMYSDSHVFSSNNTSYVTPSSVINLKAGVPYTIKRIQTDWGMYITNTIGRVAMNDTMNFPYTDGVITITNSKFHQNGGPLYDTAIPYIELTFR